MSSKRSGSQPEKSEDDVKNIKKKIGKNKKKNEKIRENKTFLQQFKNSFIDDTKGTAIILAVRHRFAVLIFFRCIWSYACHLSRFIHCLL
jgi:hypothetical protein